MKPDLRVKIGSVEFKNPVIMASGTFGFGREYKKIYDIEKLGGICTKGLTLEKKEGNEGIRIHETPSGVMNSIGLENPGVEGFISSELEFVKSLNTTVMVNVGGSLIEDYVKAVALISEQHVDAIELNISCPNVKKGGIAFGIREESIRQIVKVIRRTTELPLIVKLSPNAEDIVRAAQVCEDEGADGVSLINTIRSMAIDINKREPIFKNVYAGLSGPAIKPIALAMVHQVCKAVKIPVIGIGGICTFKDALEFIMAGAACIQIGSASFANPRAGLNILNGIEEFMKDEGIKSLDEIRKIV